MKPPLDPRKQPVRAAERDEPFDDPVAYGNGPHDSVTDATENAATTHHSIELGGTLIQFTAKAGHLVTVDPSSSKPDAKIFYVAFTKDGAEPTTRPVTFFYNGGPGSSSVYVLLGSFAPMRLKTSLPSFTPPAPYEIETNTDSLMDRSDLVFINPVGTGYSAAIAPKVNKDFWGTDQDATSLKQFIKRYLTANDRWNSPKFLFGESYGTARTAVLSYMLHEDGVDLNGVTIQSSILDYAQAGNPVGLLPTCAADAWYHGKVTVQPMPADLASFADQVMRFADTDYAAALRQMPHPNADTVRQISDRIGIDPQTLLTWNLNVAAANDLGTSLFLVTLLKEKGLALGSYDGRATAVDTGIAEQIDPKSGGNDPTMTAVNGAYTVMWNTYLNEDLRFTSTSSFTDLNDQAFANWDFHHVDPTGAQKGIDDKGNVILYTAGDLAATMSLNIDLKVLSANGYYDSVTPFHQTILDLQAMPLVNQTIRQNLTIRCYPSGHMIYLDGASRTALKADLVHLYDVTTADHAAMARVRSLQRSTQEAKDSAASPTGS
ncbi:S10 family peptidase [Rhodopila sp.]|uniref:S10 family peptidase n=1 Tax=Rhodopila sp. TaxID=2480087 RepID=UPI003D117B3A